MLFGKDHYKDQGRKFIERTLYNNGETSCSAQAHEEENGFEPELI